MKNIKSILSLLLLAIMVLGLIACEDKGNNDGSEGNTEPAGDATIVLFENEKWSRPIVRSDKWSNAESEVLRKLRDDMRDITDQSPKLQNDFKRPEESYDSESLEILFGNTAHEPMRELYSSLGYGEAEIKVVGNKILCAAYTMDGLTAIRMHLTTLFEENYKDGKLEVKVSDLEMKKVVDENANKIPMPDVASYSSTEDCALDQTLIIFDDSSEEDFKNYRKKFEGCELVSESDANGNFFATYKMDKDLVNISYAKHDKKLRVVFNKDTETPKWFEKQEVKAVTTPMIIMHGLGWNGTENQNGLCLLFRLSDGRFIVVDGGFNRAKDAADLYDLMVKYGPKGSTPTIAAWFITHAHGDHNGMFINRFAGSYRNKVKVESVIFNPPAPALNQTEKNEGGSYQSTITVAKNLPGCQFIRCHTGDKYFIGDAEIDMLYTVDYQYPKAFTYYNTCSHIFSIKLGGQRIIVTGDGANSSFGHVQKMFGETLKADVVQVAHHGYSTGVSASASTDIMQAYTYMSPSLVLWPIGQYGYENTKNSSYNQHLVNLPSVKEVVVARAADHIFELPYTPKQGNHQ